MRLSSPEDENNATDTIETNKTDRTNDIRLGFVLSFFSFFRLPCFEVNNISSIGRGLY